MGTNDANPPNTPTIQKTISQRHGKRKPNGTVRELIAIQQNLADRIQSPETPTLALPDLVRSYLALQSELRLLTGRSFGPLSGPLPKRLAHLASNPPSLPGLPKAKPMFQAPTEPAEEPQADNPEEF